VFSNRVEVRNGKRRPGRVRLALAAGGTAVLLAGGVTGCELEDALDCGRVALNVADALDDVQQARDTDAALRALDRLDKQLDKLGDDAGSSDVKDGIDKINDGVKDVRDDLNADREPNFDKLVDGTEKLTSACGGN
jgi:hypothetical protein